MPSMGFVSLGAGIFLRLLSTPPHDDAVAFEKLSCVLLQGTLASKRIPHAGWTNGSGPAPQERGRATTRLLRG